MYQSVTTHPDGLPPPPSSSVVTGVRKSTTYNHQHHQHHNHHHGTTAETNKNGRSNTLLVGRGESGFDGNGLLPKSSSSSSPPKTQDHTNGNLPNLGPKTGNSNPPQPQQAQAQKTHDSRIKTQHTHESTSGQNPNHNGGDVLLQWGQRKRSKRTVGDKFSGSHSMPPPPHPPPFFPSASGGGGCRGGGGGSGGTKLRHHNNGVLYSKDASSSLLSTRNRNLEDMMGGGSNGSPSSKSNGGSLSISRSALGKRSHSATERTDSKRLAHHHPPSYGGSISGGSIRKDKPTDPLLQLEQPNHHHYHNHQASPAREAENSHGKCNGEAVEWPRIYVALSRKEKEEDFFAMKGTKLPHRPKKRSKAVDKTLQYCFPGMWLSDLTRSRYEVRERKNVKKPKRRGLKGLESVDSDSE